MVNHSRETLKANMHNIKLPYFIRSKTPPIVRYILKMLKFEKKMHLRVDEMQEVWTVSASGIICYTISISIVNYNLLPNAP